MFTLIAAYALMASTFSIGWAVMQYAQPFFTIGFRMILAGCLLLGYQYFFNRSRLSIHRKDWLLFLQAICFHIFLSYVTEFYAFKTVSGAKVALLYNMSPFVAALLSYFAIKERMSLRKWLGLLIGFFGFLPILIAQTSTEAQATHIGFFSFAELGLIISVISASYGWVVVKQLVRRDYSVFTVNGVAMLGGGALAMISSMLFEPWNPLPVTHFWPFFTGILALILIGNIICFNIFGYHLRSYSATFVTFVGFLTPLFTALYDWIFFGHVVSVAFFTTLALVSVGLYIFYQEELKHIHAQE